MIAVGFGIFSDSLLYGIVVPLTPLSPAGVTSEAAIGMLYGGYALGVLLLTPLCGLLADRIGRKRPMLVGVVIQLLATFVFAFAPDFWVLLLARMLQGGAAAATWTAGLAIVAESYPEDRVQKMGLSMVGMTAGSLIGPLVGGLLYDVGGYYAPFYLAAGVVVVDFFLRLTLLPWDRGQEQISNPLPVLLRDRSVFVAAVVVALIAGGWGVLEPHLPGHLSSRFGISSTMVGLLFTSAGVAYALVTTSVQRMTERRGLRDTITLGLVMMAVGMPLLILSPDIWLTTALLCLVSVAYALALNPTLAELADAADRVMPGAYASVYAVFNIAYALGMIGADIIVDPLTEHFSLLTGYIGISVVLVCSLPLLWWSYKPRRALASAT
jgi:MFS transporter, DHA1 family, solute carrier family 18 (vesicular amine transporter), member 1/2